MGTDMSSNSARQLYKYLGYPTTSEKSTFEDINKAVNNTKKLATYIFTKSPLKNEYEKKIKDAFNATVDNVKTLAGQEPRINKMIEDNTGGEIKEFFEKGSFTSDTMALLLNTILFSEQWKTTFDGKTRSRKWYGPQKQTNVDFMTTEKTTSREIA